MFWYEKDGVKLLSINDISAFKGVISCSLADTVLSRNLLPPSSGWKQLNVASFLRIEAVSAEYYLNFVSSMRVLV
jgi:hypothetical protein